MSNVVSSTQFINYISEFKKKLVGRNNNPVSVKFKIDNRINDLYSFQMINSNNQIVDLESSLYNYQFYGSFVDARNQSHTLFYSNEYSITSANVISFRVNTFTSEYLHNVKTPREIDITIKKKKTEPRYDEIVILRDSGIAYPGPVQPGQEPTPVVAGEGLSLNGYVMSLQNPLSTSFGAGSGITFIQPSPSLFTFAFGKELMAGGDQFVIGKYNEIDYNAPFIIGWGNSDERNNIFTVDSLGNVSGTAFYANGVQVATINEVSGITYTAGEGIGIDSNNVISLTATIPSSVTQFDDTKWLIKTLLNSNSITASVYRNSPSGSDWYVGIDYNSLHNAGFAYTSAIPTSTSQLTNDSDYITNSDLANYALTSDLANYATTGALNTVSSAIPLSTSQLTNDSNYATSSYVQSVSGTITGWVDEQDYADIEYVKGRVNISPIYNDTLTHSQNNYILPYNYTINIYKTKHFAYSDGKVYINALSTVPTNNNAFTIEHHIEGFDVGDTAFDGFVIDQNINVIGDLPSAFVAGTTYVFTRRLININNTTTEFISFAYSY